MAGFRSAMAAPAIATPIMAIAITAGAEVTEAVFIIDLPGLGGGAKLREAGMKVHALVEFEGD